MAVIIITKKRHALQERGVHRSLRNKGVFPGNFPSSDFLIKLFQFNP